MHFQYGKKVYVNTDAWDYVVAGVMSQVGEDGLLHPVAFLSIKMTPQEKNYEIYGKELLAVVMVLEQWRLELVPTKHPLPTPPSTPPWKRKAITKYTHLRKQHVLFKIATGGELIHVPLPADQPIRILDSATNDGTWLVEVGAQYPNATLVGTENNTAHFTQIQNLPNNLSFKTLSIFDPWPAEDWEA
jgi:hypothetical protein